MMTVDQSLYVIVDPQFTGGRDPIAVARAALLGGATMLQLRDKSASTRVLLATAWELVALAHKRGAPLIVNDRVDVALAAGADGVHLGPDDLPVTAARSIMGPRALIGFSAGTPDEARDAEQSGADYLGTGAIYATSSKADAGPAIGVAGLVAVCRATRLPVVAIGGIGQGPAAPCIAAGAAGVAVITAVTQAADVERAARALRDEVDAARRAERA
jgi:thiamine-phosphate diphosphorylase